MLLPLSGLKLKTQALQAGIQVLNPKISTCSTSPELTLEHFTTLEVKGWGCGLAVGELALVQCVTLSAAPHFTVSLQFFVMQALGFSGCDLPRTSVLLWNLLDTKTSILKQSHGTWRCSIARNSPATELQCIRQCCFGKGSPPPYSDKERSPNLYSGTARCQLSPHATLTC